MSIALPLMRSRGPGMIPWLMALLGVVGVVGVRKRVLGGVETVGVLVAAQDVDGIATDAQPWARNDSLVDGIAHGGVGRASSFGAHVTLGSETGHQGCLRGLFCKNRAPGHGLLDSLQVLRAGMQKQMHMRVNQARQQSCVAEIDYLRTLRMFDRNTHCFDAFALDQNLAGLKDVSGIDFKQPRRVQHDGCARRLLGTGANGRDSKKHHREHKGQTKVRKGSPHGYDYAAICPGLSTKNFSRIGSPLGRLSTPRSQSSSVPGSACECRACPRRSSPTRDSCCAA